MSHESELPKAVRDQIEAAEEVYKAVYPDETPPAEDPPAEDPPAEDPPQDPPNDEVTPPKDEVTPPADPPPTPQEDGWEHKFKVLKGKYDKEVPRLHRDLRAANSANQKLQDRVSQLETTMKQMRETPAPAEPDNPLTPEEITQFGPDLIDVIRRVAKSETGVVLDAQLRPIKETVEHVQETVASTTEDDTVEAQERMLTDLAEAVPGWQKQNEDEDFLDWLDLKDPYSGKVRTELLAEAWKSHDSERLIALFEGFLKENAVVNPSDEPSNETPVDETPAEETPSAEQPLDELVAPGTPKTGSTGAQNESGKKVWTQREIKAFYARKNEFIKKHPERDLPENLALQEKDIFAAQHEDRIRP